MIPRFDEPIRPGIAYRNRPGVYALITRGDGVLVTFQAGVHQEFQLPGGGIDPGEGVLSALYREIREETGWKVSDPRRVGSFQRYTEMPEYGYWARKVCHIYHCHPVYAKWPIMEADHSAVWMHWREAEAVLANEGDRYYLRRLFLPG